MTELVPYAKANSMSADAVALCRPFTPPAQRNRIEDDAKPVIVLWDQHRLGTADDRAEVCGDHASAGGLADPIERLERPKRLVEKTDTYLARDVGRASCVRDVQVGVPGPCVPER